MRTIVTVLAAMLAAACSSSQKSSGGPCAARSGTYLVHYTPHSGDCGGSFEVVVVMQPGTSGGSTPTTGCTGSVQESSDHCTTTTGQFTCPTNSGDGSTLTESGDVHWAADGASGNGTLQLTLNNRDGSVACTGAYDVNYQRR